MGKHATSPHCTMVYFNSYFPGCLFIRSSLAKNAPSPMICLKFIHLSWYLLFNFKDHKLFNKQTISNNDLQQTICHNIELGLPLFSFGTLHDHIELWSGTLHIYFIWLNSGTLLFYLGYSFIRDTTVYALQQEMRKIHSSVFTIGMNIYLQFLWPQSLELDQCLSRKTLCDLE